MTDEKAVHELRVLWADLAVNLRASITALGEFKKHLSSQSDSTMAVLLQDEREDETSAALLIRLDRLSREYAEALNEFRRQMIYKAAQARQGGGE